MSPPSAADLRPSSPAIPAKFLAHLGITPADLDAIAARGLTLEEAVANGVLKLPPEVLPEEFPQYLRDLEMYVDIDRVPEDPFFDTVVFEGSVKDAIKLGLIDDPCSASD